MTRERTQAEVFPPGDIIADELEERGWTQDDLAQITGMPLPNINRIIKAKAGITVDVARKFGAAFGVTPEFFINMETRWQLHLSRQNDSDLTSMIRERARIYDAAPVREMIRRGWIEKGETPEETLENLLNHFEVDSLDEIPNLRVAARASSRGDADELTPSQVAWACRCRAIACQVETEKYSKPSLRKLIPHLASSSVDPEAVRDVPRLLAEVGVRFVVVERLKGTKIDGAALQLNSSREPIIAMSLRYGRLDYFWHTLMHEVVHILRGDLDRIDSEIGMHGHEVDEIEREVDEVAANHLVPNDAMDAFIEETSPLYDARKVKAFAADLGVHPSIVAGQLKHRGEIKWQAMVSLNVDVRNIVREMSCCDGWGVVAQL